MELYIKGINTISPVGSFDNIDNLPEIKATEEGLKYYSCIEPLAYKEIINPVLIRRMSRAMKIGIASALFCLKDAKLEMPDAIITGTGLGCVEDSDKFLVSLIENEEKMLNPTPFIQSTHNTISSQIALMLKCHGYNSTYAGRGACFETGMLDALMLISDGEASNVLVGAYDELIQNQIKILYRLGQFRNNNTIKNISGNLPGEGAAFFVLSDKQSDTDYAKLVGMEIISSDNFLTENICDFLNKYSIELKNINSILLGSENFILENSKYSDVINIFPYSNLLWFKHLCGEYMTDSSFALWLASNILKTQNIPEKVIIKKNNTSAIDNILIINKISGNQTVLFLLKK